jgi:uncharacterized phage protein gp47/JayE
MFESMTYEYIINEMLNNVSSDVDKREGSIIYDALAPVAYMLAQTYFHLDQFIDLVSGDTAVGEYLDRVVADYGITRKPATYAIRKIETTGPVDIGTRWGINDASYVITALLSENVYSATCEQLGEVGNIYSGALDNIDNISGVTATLTDIITSGEEEETDDNLRSRFYLQVQAPITSGNADNYVKWALEVPGVGKAKVFPTWNGPGTVKVLVVDENKSIETTLVPTVAAYIETVRPVGATVTVDCPTSHAINVTANVILDGSKTLADVQMAFKAALTAYLKDTVFETYSVSYAKVGSLLLAVDGVSDYNALLVNAGTDSIVLNDTEIPICGTVTLSEVI